MLSIGGSRGVQGSGPPPLFSKIIGIDVYSGFRRSVQYIYSGSRKTNSSGGGGGGLKFEILYKFRNRLNPIHNSMCIVASGKPLKGGGAILIPTKVVPLTSKPGSATVKYA